MPVRASTLPTTVHLLLVLVAGFWLPSEPLGGLDPPCRGVAGVRGGTMSATMPGSALLTVLGSASRSPGISPVPWTW